MKHSCEVERKNIYLKGVEYRKSSNETEVEEAYEFTLNEKIRYDKHYKVLAICDFLIIITVIQVNVIGFWRGLFGILFTFHEYSQLSMIFFLGCFLQFQFAIFKNKYKKYLQEATVCNKVFKRVYIYVSSSSCILMWAGLWYALDETSGLDIRPPLLYSVICYIILLYFKFSKNLLAPPCCVAIDSSTDQVLEFPTAFKTTISRKGSSDVALYILDCFFSVFVIGCLVVFIWRGIWCLTDIFLFPENAKYSALCSLAIGYAVVFIIFGLQTPMERVMGRLKGFWRLLVADIYVFVSVIGTINIWRGIWNLLNIYFLPEFPLLSCWITHIGCFILLVLLNCSNTILVRGIYLDGEDGEKCVAFPTLYLRLIFQNQLKTLLENGSVPQSNSCSTHANKVGEDIENGSLENRDNSKNQQL